MRQEMRNELRAYLEGHAWFPSTAKGVKVGDAPVDTAKRGFFGFLMKDGVEPVRLTAADLYDLEADAFIVDRTLGSFGIVHCLEGAESVGWRRRFAVGLRTPRICGTSWPCGSRATAPPMEAVLVSSRRSSWCSW